VWLLVILSTILAIAIAALILVIVVSRQV
jgi:hypothetical protein